MVRPYNLQQMSSGERAFLTKDPAKYEGLLIDTDILQVALPLLGQKFAFGFNPKYAKSIGTLTRLPLEILHMVFRHLPVRSCTNLMQTNSKAYHLITNWPGFFVVHRAAPNLVRAVTALHINWAWTYPQLEEVIFSTKCEVCQEHGDIVYCAKLMRCCFRCLSTDRRLLAVTTIYAENEMGASLDDFAGHVPMFRTPPQPEWWDYCNMQDRHIAVDYTSVTQFATSKSTERFKNPKCPLELPPKLEVTSDWCDETTMVTSIRRHPSTSIQQRRSSTKGLPQLFLPSYLTNPPEGHSVQYLCSIYQPPKTKYFKEVPLDQGKPEGPKTVQLMASRHSARGCAGCAHFWNYHCPLPGAYHTVYDVGDDFGDDLSDMSSDLMHHLKYCIYAQLYWRKLYPESYTQLSPNPYKVMLMRHAAENCLRYARSGYPNEETRNAMFELIPDRPLTAYYDNAVSNAAAFTAPSIWPASPSTFNYTHPNLELSRTAKPSYITASGATHRPKSIAIPAVLALPPTPDSPTFPTDPVHSFSLEPEPDEYGDMLFSSLAVSQSTWATSNFYNPYNLLVGPVCLLRMKAQRERRRICNLYGLRPDSPGRRGVRDEEEVKKHIVMYPDIDKGWETTGEFGKGIVLDWFG